MPYSGSFLQTSWRFVFPRLGFITKDRSLHCWSSAHLAASLRYYHLILHITFCTVPLVIPIIAVTFFNLNDLMVFQILRSDWQMWTQELFLRFKKDLKETMMLSNLSYNRLGSAKNHHVWGIFLVLLNFSQTPQWRCWKTYLRHYSCMTS